MQDLLWLKGAFRGLKNALGRELTYKEAVDGIRGKITELAIQRMPKKAVPSRKGTTIVGELFNNAVELISKKNYREGFLNLVSSAILASPIGYSVGQVLQKSYDNAYPYSYGDVVETSLGLLLYRNNSEGKVRQTTANDPALLLVTSLLNKFINGVKGKDPRREYIETLANLDLSTSEGLRKWNELTKNAPNGTIRINGNPLNAQFEIRARLDLMNMYANRPQLWDTYEINPIYNSPTAKARGASTYRIKDPVQRERINGEMVNYFLNHSKEGYWTSDNSAYILPMMGYMGNLSLIADDEKGTNLRYGDWWDYTVNNPYAKRFYTGDILTESGKTPTRSKYGTGHNTKHMTELSEDLIKNLIKENPTFTELKNSLKGLI